MINAIAEVFGSIISFIYGIVPNLGITIIIMTLLVKLVTFPLNNKQIQSAKNTQKLQPELKKLQEKYKHDKEKQSQVVQEFMKENKMNPLSGCLPVLVQFPILIGLFRALRDAGTFLEGLKYQDYFLFKIAEKINLVEAPNLALPDFKAEGLAGLTHFLSGIFSSEFIFILPIVAGVTTYLYSKMSMTASGDSSQKMMQMMMPGMITVFSFTVPAGVVIYWVVNNLFSMAQHKLVVMLEKNKEPQETEDKKKAKKETEAEKSEIAAEDAAKKDKKQVADKSIIRVFDEIEGKSSRGGQNGLKHSKGKGKKGKGKK